MTRYREGRQPHLFRQRELKLERYIALGQESPEKTPEWLAANERLHYKLKVMIPWLKEYPYCVGEE